MSESDHVTSDGVDDVMANSNAGSDVADVTDSFSFLNQHDESVDQDNRSISSGHSVVSSESKHSSSGQRTASETGADAHNGHNSFHDDPPDVTQNNTDDVTWNTAPRQNTEKSSNGKNLFNFFRRLTSKSDLKNKDADSNQKPTMSKFDQVLLDVKVDSLPQVFVTKYMGCKPCHGLWGIKHTRGPVEEMIEEITTMIPDAGEDLPLVQLRVSLSGIHIREHSANMCKTKKIEREHIPIEFVSYGVQDVKHTRVFAFILVREMSSKSRKLECHAYICDSTANCRRLSLSVALAFQDYSKTLNGKPFKFQVDLRSGEESQEELNDNKPTPAGEDFEA